MSGGRFGFIHDRDASQLFDDTSMLEHMVDALSALGYAKDAAQETYALLLLIRQSQARIEMMQERLAVVWKAMDRWKTADTDENDFKAVLQKYRGE